MVSFSSAALLPILLATWTVCLPFCLEWHHLPGDRVLVSVCMGSVSYGDSFLSSLVPPTICSSLGEGTRGKRGPTRVWVVLVAGAPQPCVDTLFIKPASLPGRVQTRATTSWGRLPGHPCAACPVCALGPVHLLPCPPEGESLASPAVWGTQEVRVPPCPQDRRFIS